MNKALGGKNRQVFMSIRVPPSPREIGLKGYRHESLTAGTKSRVEHRAGDVNLKERREWSRKVGEGDDAIFKCDCK